MVPSIMEGQEQRSLGSKTGRSPLGQKALLALQEPREEQLHLPSGHETASR